MSRIAETQQNDGATAVRLEIRSGASLHWQRWEQDFIVFDAGSGHTHQLDALTASALLAIEESSSSTDVLMAWLVVDLSLPVEALQLALPTVIEQLRSVGLIDIISE